jgi:hypothetical protein
MGYWNPFDVEHPNDWFEKELAQITDINQRAILQRVAKDLGSFVRWPSKALLFLTPEKYLLTHKSELSYYSLA